MMAADAATKIATRTNPFVRIPLYSSHRSLDRWRARLIRPVAKAEEQRQPLIYRGHLLPRKLSKHPPDPSLVNRSQMVDQREGLPGEAALARREWRIQESLARSSRHRHKANQWKALVADDIRIAHHNAGPHAVLFVAECGV